jgi:hypothetical protein
MAGLLRVDEDYRGAQGFHGRSRRFPTAKARAILVPVRYLLDTNTGSDVIKGNFPMCASGF